MYPESTSRDECPCAEPEQLAMVPWTKGTVESQDHWPSLGRLYAPATKLYETLRIRRVSLRVGSVCGRPMRVSVTGDQR